MKKEEKEVLKYLIEKELAEMRKTEKDIEFPSPGFIKSREMYEEILESLLKSIK